MQQPKFLPSGQAGTFIVREQVTESEIMEMALHLSNQRISARQKVDSPQLIVNHLRCLYRESQKETLGAIFLDQRLSIIVTKEYFCEDPEFGIKPRELTRDALMLNAYGMIVFNNQLIDENAIPASRIKRTLNLAKACSIVGMTLVDHLFITPTSHKSFADLGYL